MDETLASGIRDWFLAYVDRFRSGGDLAPMQQLKLDHSLRVAEAAETLARHQGWSAPEVRLAHATGLLHDVGRFPQFARYGTFADRHSVDHARLGYEVLQAENALAPLDPAAAGTLADAVNCLAIPTDLPPQSLPLVRLTRDADKLDIYRVVLDAITSGAVRRHPEILVGVDLDGPPGPAVLAAVAAGRMASHHDVHSMADYLLLMAGWVYDINYPATLHELRRRRVLETMAELLPDQPEVRAALARVLAERDRRPA